MGKDSSSLFIALYGMSNILTSGCLVHPNQKLYSLKIVMGQLFFMRLLFQLNKSWTFLSHSSKNITNFKSFKRSNDNPSKD